jgi:hypothetical protein
VYLCAFFQTFLVLTYTATSVCFWVLGAEFIRCRALILCVSEHQACAFMLQTLLVLSLCIFGAKYTYSARQADKVWYFDNILTYDKHVYTYTLQVMLIRSGVAIACLHMTHARTHIHKYMYTALHAEKICYCHNMLTQGYTYIHIHTYILTADHADKVWQSHSMRRNHHCGRRAWS